MSEHEETVESGGMSVSAEEIVDQLNRHDPLLLELLALRALIDKD